MYRDPYLLKVAKGEACLLNISPKCLGDEGSTTVAAHSNQLMHGKGKGLKAEDCYTVWACYKCHTMMDQGKMDSDALVEAFESAWIRQIEAWREMADNICLKPWKQDACQRVMAYLRSKHG